MLPLTGARIAGKFELVREKMNFLPKARRITSSLAINWISGEMIDSVTILNWREMGFPPQNVRWKVEFQLNDCFRVTLDHPQNDSHFDGTLLIGGNLNPSLNDWLWRPSTMLINGKLNHVPNS
jgi:hypothetical protein